MAHLAKMCAAAFVVTAASSFGNGCAAQTDDAARVREALPAQEEVTLGVPGTANGTASTSQGLHIATGDTQIPTARFYQMTRDVTMGVDLGTALILGGVWTIVQAAPTSVEPKKVVWGPGAANALEPAVWRFTANEVGDAEYDYVLEGQPKDGGAWLSVLVGHAYGKTRPEHKQGWFKFDNDAYKNLEPSRGKDEGTTKITYDLRQLPATIAVELRPSPEKGWADVLVTHDVGGAGSVSMKMIGDIDPSKTTKLEQVDILSRWTSNGSGRADALLKDGDLPISVDASECWSSSFARVFYKDTVNSEPPTGDASACALPAAAP